MTPNATRGELFALWPEWEASANARAAAERKRRLYVGDYKPDVQRMVRDRISDGESKEEVCKFVNTAHGLLGAVADVCAVVYQRGVRRELRGTSGRAAAAFSVLVLESGIAALGPALNALSWATGPVIAVPHVAEVRGELQLLVHLVTADRYAVRHHPSAPDVLLAVLLERADGAFVEVDDKRWRYWSADGSPLDGGKWDAEHGLGYCPAAPIRARPWLAYDWRGATDHAGLCDAALEVAYLHALGRWVRTQNMGPLTEITAPPEKYPKLQSLGHPSRPVVFDAIPGEVRVATHDRTVDPKHYLSEIQALVNAAVSRYGIPPSAVTFTNDMSNWGALSINTTPGAMAAQRDAQTPLLREGELTLWRMACDVVRASRHPLARDLPPADEVRRALRVAFPDLSSPAEQQMRMTVFEQQLPHGLASAEELLMRDRPELTRAEASEEVAANLAEYTRRLAEITARNQAHDAARNAEMVADFGRGVQSIPQQQGREGGRASAEARRANEDGG